MTTVRYPLPFPSWEDRSFTIDMPEGARVVHVGVADTKPREPSMWVEQTDEPVVPRRFYSMGFGFEVSREALAGEHVGTWRMNGNTWHIFEGEPDDVGPPAPGEGDELENPEIGMVC